MKGVVVFTAAVFCGTSAWAEAACEPLVTAIYDDCSIQNHVRCDDGTIRVTEFEYDEPVSIDLSTIDQQLISFHTLGEGMQIDVLGAPDQPFSLNTLLTTGRADASFMARVSGDWMMPPEARMTQSMQLNGQQDIFYARAFDVVETVETLQMGFGGNSATITGSYILEAELGLLIERHAVTSFMGQEISDLPSLKDLAYPGDAFFMANDPDFVCQLQLSSLEVDAG